MATGLDTRGMFGEIGHKAKETVQESPVGRHPKASLIIGALGLTIWSGATVDRSPFASDSAIVRNLPSPFDVVSGTAKAGTWVLDWLDGPRPTSSQTADIPPSTTAPSTEAATPTVTEQPAQATASTLPADSSAAGLPTVPATASQASAPANPETTPQTSPAANNEAPTERINITVGEAVIGCTDVVWVEKQAGEYALNAMSRASGDEPLDNIVGDQANALFNETQSLLNGGQAIPTDINATAQFWGPDNCTGYTLLP